MTAKAQNGAKYFSVSLRALRFKILELILSNLDNLKKLKEILNLIFVLAVVVSISCNRDNNHPGYIYTPDMTYSQAYEPFAENPLFADSNNMQAPIEGTVPREMIPYQFKKTKEKRLRAGQVLINLLEKSPQVTAEGKELFELICKQCHGGKGDGQGKLFVDKLYPYPPASLISEKLKAAPDGEIYHVISVGFNLMGSYSSILTQEERWTVVQYIRELQKQSGTKSD